MSASEVSFETARPVRLWLLAGVVMIFFQVVLGGITRLTGSGLSITRWEIVTGTLPPLSEQAWHRAFELYKQTPQYQKINAGMTMEAFKRIYFWEYVHRLWARTMGFVFLLPLVFFWRRRMLSPSLKRRLWVVFLLAALAASFGWIMVASGLVDRPWVNAYKLMIHLGIAIFLLEYLLVTYLRATGKREKIAFPLGKAGSLVGPLLVLISWQVLLGGLMSGMKAGYAFPTFPRMNGVWIPEVLLDPKAWTWENMRHYDSGHLFAPALVQLLHRTLAYLIGLVAVVVLVRSVGKATGLYRRLGILFFGLVCCQILLGIFTLLSFRTGAVSVLLGSLHQLVGILTLSVWVAVWYFSRGKRYT